LYVRNTLHATVSLQRSRMRCCIQVEIFSSRITLVLCTMIIHCRHKFVALAVTHPSTSHAHDGSSNILGCERLEHQNYTYLP
jgi:hypothetical protein